MATFDFVVDTNPMAESVSTVSRHVNGTTAAVVAMESAVIASEQSASEKICNNVTTGFHVLIQSQVSQKAAGYFSQMSSKMVLLLEFSKSLGSLQSRMNNDFQRLKREYMKIFHGLDKALENRIRQLDKKAMELGDIKESLVTSRISKDAPSTLIYAKDTQNTAGLVFNARIKSKTHNALDNMSRNVFSTHFYKKQLDSVLQESDSTENALECIPVVFTEEKSPVVVESLVNNLYVSDSVGGLSKSTISTSVMQNIKNYTDAKKSQAETEEVKNEFMKLLSSSNLDERTSAQVISLFNAQNGGGQ